MKHAVNCPVCGHLRMRLVQMSVSGPSMECLACGLIFSERDMLKHMRTKPYLNPNAPAFRVLDIKPKPRSQAARTVFG